jgi:predicted DNA-binding transcriptional regulator AlpA
MTLQTQWITTMTIPPEFDPAFTRKQAAEILGCSVRTIIRIEQDGDLPRVQISPGIVGYRGSALKRYMAERTVIRTKSGK